MSVGPGGLLIDCDREAFRCGKEALKVSSSSGLGFWELVLQRGQVRYSMELGQALCATRSGLTGASPQRADCYVPVAEHRWGARGRRPTRRSFWSIERSEVARWGGSKVT